MVKCDLCGNKITVPTNKYRLTAKIRLSNCTVAEALSSEFGVPLTIEQQCCVICRSCKNIIEVVRNRRRDFNASLSRLYDNSNPSLYIGGKLREFITTLRGERPESCSSSSSTSFSVPAPGASQKRPTDLVTHRNLPMKKRKFSSSGGKIRATPGSVTIQNIPGKKQRFSSSGGKITAASGSVIIQSFPMKKQRLASSGGKMTPASCVIIVNGNMDNRLNRNVTKQEEMTPSFIASKYVRSSRYGLACRLLSKHSKAFRREVQKLVKKEVHAEVRNMGKPAAASIWKGSFTAKKLQNYRSFSLKEAMSETQSKCPFLYSAVLGAATAIRAGNRRPKGNSEIARHLKPVVGAALGMLMFLGDPRMKLFQELIGLELWLSHCGPEAFRRLHSLGMCTSLPITKQVIATMVKELDDDLLEKKKELESSAENEDEEDEDEASNDGSQSLSIAEAAENEDGEDEDEASNDGSQSIAEEEAEIGDSSDEAATEEETSSVDSSSLDGTIDYSCLDRVEGARAGYTIVFDNVSEMTRARYGTHAKDEEMPNMVQAYAAFDRVPSYHLDDTPPTANDILRIDPKVYLPNENDEILLRQEYTVIVQRILTRLMPCFQRFAERVEDHIPHPHFRESKQKSRIIPLGVLSKDETQTSDLVDILRNYHDYVPCRDGKPITTILHGDGLGCERVRDAQSEMIDATDSQNRLDGLYPTAQEWHKHCLLLEDTYKLLYDVRSSRAVGTLSYIKYKFHYRNVEPDTAAHSFDAATDLLQLSTEAYVVAAACVQMGIDDPGKMPEDLPEGIKGLYYFHDVASLVVDMAYQRLEVPESENQPYPYCICRNDIEDEMVLCKNPLCSRGSWFHISCMNLSPEDVPEQGKYFCSAECSGAWQKKKGVQFQPIDDHVFQYSKAMLFRGLGERARYDAIRENDGERIISHWRYDMVEFQEMHHPKYFIEGFHLLTDMNGGASERVAHQMKWNRTVNMCGARGHNVSMGLAMNHLNKEFKLAMKAWGEKITPSTMKRYSRILGIWKDLRSQLGVTKSKCVSDLCGSQDIQEDTLKLAKLLLDNDCLKEIPGRSHNGFGDFVFEHALREQHRFIECIENQKKKRAECMDTARGNVPIK